MDKKFAQQNAKRRYTKSPKFDGGKVNDTNVIISELAQLMTTNDNDTDLIVTGDEFFSTEVRVPLIGESISKRTMIKHIDSVFAEKIKDKDGARAELQMAWHEYSENAEIKLLADWLGEYKILSKNELSRFESTYG